MPTELAIPLAQWADRQLRSLATATRSDRIALLSGAGLLGERAMLNGFRVPGSDSAGGGCRLYPARDGWLALSLNRPDDRRFLPALFGEAAFDPSDDVAVAQRIAARSTAVLVAQGADLGLALGASDEMVGPAWAATSRSTDSCAATGGRPLVVDLSALWAGPLASHLLALAGATVVKVESTTRPDSVRAGDPALFALLNQDKASVAVDLANPGGRAALVSLLTRADIVIESSRPRALLQLGIDADALVARIPGLVWVTITGHGMREEGDNRVGFGDDCGVAGGLVDALRHAHGTAAFVGDAIADPTGIFAARLAWDHWAAGTGVRAMVSMSGVVRSAIGEERARDGRGFDRVLCSWAEACGRAFPAVRQRPAEQARPFGADTADWLQC